MFSMPLRRMIALTAALLMLLPGSALGKDPMLNEDPDKYYVELDTANQVVTVYQRDDDGEYTRIVRRFVCTSGKTEPTVDEPASPTPAGTWKAGARERFGKFANFAGEYARYWTQIVGGVYFHSIMFGSRDTADLKRSPFNTLGSRASHGCVRLYVEDAKWLYENACFATTVKVTSGRVERGLAKSLKTDMTFAEYRDFQANIYTEDPLPDPTAWVTVDGAQLRTGNGTNDKLIMKLDKDTEMEVLQEGDPWVKVVANDREGYVRRCYITYEKGVMQSREDGYYVAGTQYLYESPDTSAPKICKVARHSTIVVLDEHPDPDGKWVLIDYWGTEGYLQRRHLKSGWATIYESPEEDGTDG